MTGVIEGYVALAFVIAVGWLVARVNIVGESGANVLSRISFNVAVPALMITMLLRTDLGVIFSGLLLISLISVAVTCLVAVLAARLIWRRNWSDTVVAAFCSCYVNAANLGLPIAAYVLGDSTLVVPMLLVQVLILQPLGLTVLDVLRARTNGLRLSLGLLITRPFRNPLTAGTIIGAALALGHVQLPNLISLPLGMLSGMAVPANLMAFGMALHYGPRPGAGSRPLEMGSLVFLKLLFQPSLAFVLSRFVFGLDPGSVFALTIIAALPTAQNVYVNANRYGSGMLLARDQVFLSTVAAVPVLLAITALLG